NLLSKRAVLGCGITAAGVKQGVRGAGAEAVPPPPCADRGGFRIRMTRLRWGILGPGRIAPRIVRALVDNPRSELHAVASRDLARARSFADRHAAARAYDAYEALLADPDVDVVYIALPNHLHAPWTVRALDAGKHVLCE